AAGPAVREDERHAPAGCRALVHKMDALPLEMMEGVKPRLPGAPIELIFIGPIGDEALQPLQLSSLLPADAGHLVWPSRTPQSRAEVVKGFIRDVNAKWFQSISL